MQSYIPLFRRFQSATYRRIVYAQMRRDLSQPIAMLSIGFMNDLALRAPLLKQHDQRGPTGLGLLSRNLANLSTRLMSRDKVFST